MMCETIAAALGNTDAQLDVGRAVDQQQKSRQALRCRRFFFAHARA